MSTYNEVTPARVAVGQPVSTALMSDLANNLLGVIERAAGAPKILGVPYDYQEFLASGTWTKPANAEAGDKVYLIGCGAGGSGAADTGFTEAGGGAGGAGGVRVFDDIDDLASTMNVSIGAGGAGRTNSNQTGQSGGSTIFGTSGNFGYTVFGGGPGGQTNRSATSRSIITIYDPVNARNITMETGEGRGQSFNDSESELLQGARFGGAGGNRHLGTAGAASLIGGHGGGQDEAGQFPGGGGGGSASSSSGAGANGRLIVICVKEE